MGDEPLYLKFLGQTDPVRSKMRISVVTSKMNSIRCLYAHSKMAVFHLKVHFSPRKSATKFLCCQRHSCKAFTGLSIRAKIIGVAVPFYVKIWPKLTYPFKNADFQSIFARIASAIRPIEKKSSINTNRNCTMCFPMNLR